MAQLHRNGRTIGAAYRGTKGADDEGQCGRFPGGQGNHGRAARSARSHHRGPLGRRLAAVCGAVAEQRPRRYGVSGSGRTCRHAGRAGGGRRSAPIALVANRTGRRPIMTTPEGSPFVDDDTWSAATRVASARDWEANEADLIEQAMAVPEDDDLEFDR